MTTQPQLEHLPPPSIYDDVDYETIRAAIENVLVSEIAAIDLSPGGVATILNDTHGGIVFGLAQLKNFEGLQVFLRYAEGSNLDNVGSWYGPDGARDGRTDEVYRRYLYSIALSAGSTVTEDAIKAELLRQFTETIADVSLDENYATGITTVYTLKPYTIQEDIAALRQTVDLRTAYREYITSPGVKAVGQRYTVGAESIIPYVLTATIRYSTSTFQLDTLTKLVSDSLDAYLERTFRLGGDIRLSQVNRALAVSDDVDVEVTALHKQGGAGAANILASDEPVEVAVAFTSIRDKDDIAKPVAGGISLEFIAGL